MSPTSTPAAGGGISEQTVLALVKQMTDMQARFLDHSERQMQLINRLLGQLEHAQQELRHRDSTSIRRELDELKTSMANLQNSAAARGNGQQANRHDRMADPVPQRQVAGGTRAPQVPPRVFQPSKNPARSASRRPEGTAGQRPAVQAPAPSPPATEAHAWVSRQMATVGRRPRTGWTRFLNVFSWCG